MTWAEDRATVGTDPSADPGAKTEGRAGIHLACSARSSHPLRDWHQCGKSLAAQPRVFDWSPSKKWPEFPEKCGQIFRNAQPTHTPAMALILDDDTYILAARDPERNGPGVFVVFEPETDYALLDPTE